MSRIVYCVPCLVETSGYEKIITLKANYLADVLGYETTIIAYQQRGRKPFYEVSDRVQLMDLGLEDARLTHLTVFNAFIRYREKTKIYKSLQQLWDSLFNKEVVDVVIATLPRDASFIYKLGKSRKYLFELHCSIDKHHWLSRNIFRRAYESIALWQDRQLPKHFSRTVVLTEEEKNLYWSENPRVKVIPNPITLEKTHPSDLTAKRVLAVGRISYQKGYDRLIEAWRLIADSILEWKLTIIGQCEDLREMNKTQTLIAKYKLTNVEVLPPSKNIVKEYASSSLLVMSSRFEGFPLVLLEGMACGLPCISFDCKCGPKDVITHNVDGLLVKNGDIVGLSQAILYMAENEKERRRMGANALNKAQKYTFTEIMKQWDALFQSLLSE
jgi:glycosyltransferase involved in cell wall biosynthesis